MPTTRRARKGISDAQKQALRVYASETQPTPSQRVCVEWFRSQFGRLIDRATVSKILSSKYQHLDIGPASLNMRSSTSHWPILDQALFEWQQRHQDAGFPITGPLLRLKAIEYWRKTPEYAERPVPLFSDGWLIRQYQPEDIYNMDETGLYWRRMPNGGLSTDGYAGQKRDKARVTIVVLTNSTGSDRLRAFYKNIGKQRRVLLLLDNFSAPLCALEDAPPPSNIKVVFFPANATSVYQPLNQGIIQNLKHHYRRKWMIWMINILDQNLDPKKKMSLNYTLRWLTQAWRNDVLDQTIQNCFIKSTIVSRCTDQIQSAPRPEPLELMPLYQSVINRFPADVDSDTHTVMSLDNFLNPSDENDFGESDLSDIIADISGEGGDG
ncbi:hypothetical protein N7532_003001, partial [Penicillium argentinense]